MVAILLAMAPNQIMRIELKKFDKHRELQSRRNGVKSFVDEVILAQH